MTTFLALYRGKTVGEAQLVAVSANPQIVDLVANKLLDVPAAEPPEQAASQPCANKLGQMRARRFNTGEAH